MNAEKLRPQAVTEVGGGEVMDLAPAIVAPVVRRDFAELQQEIADASNIARSTDGEERDDQIARLCNALAELGGSEDRDRAAAFLTEQLDAQMWSGLADRDGRTARAAAVDALLALGFPHALKVSPEDLQHLREIQRGGSKTAGGAGLWKWPAFAALTLGTLVQVLSMLWAGPFGLVLNALSWGAAFRALRGEQSARWAGVGILGVASIVGFANGLLAHRAVWDVAGVGVASGIAAACLAVVVSRRAD